MIFNLAFNGLMSVGNFSLGGVRFCDHVLVDMSRGILAVFGSLQLLVVSLGWA
jgi:hypothetical protein